ncbi:PREDICTED: UDP-glucuronosyltransferase-like [Wasmannia auropunctata]|uniref:UDP-glucuronosyltransferase-like n=1 Tax=Wasmannia auropunctata TaxID=64793 RepID=UPI0005F0B842|nr:PREDICTED: UDP-glucuronosyltransferase-like [Wasmannia auropunctata]
MWKIICKVFIVSSLWFLIASNITSADRILMLMPTSFYSHQIIFQSLCLALSKRGHELTIVTSISLKDLITKNYTEIYLADLKHQTNEYIDNSLEMKTSDLLKFAWKMSHRGSIETFNNSEFKEIYRHDSNKKFDAVILEVLCYPSLAVIAHRFNAPLIGLLPLGIHNYHRYLFGSPIFSSHPSNWELDVLVDENPSIWQRLWYFIDTWRLVYFWMNDYATVEQEIVEKYLGNDVPSIIDVMKNMSLLLVNENPVLAYPKPEQPNAIFFNGIHIQNPPPTLPKNLQQFLDDAMEGFIYVSFGTMATCRNLPKETLRNLVEVFSKLPYKIVWKFECDELPGKLDNAFISNWFLQQSVLAHPNIKLFIYQGGAQSTEEAVHYAVPILGIPTIFEQEKRVHRLVSFGVAECIQLNDLTKERLDSAIYQILDDKSYKEKMVYLSSLAKDQPYNNTENVIWWIEFVMRHKGIDHLRFSDSDKPWYQRYDMDIVALLALTLFIMECVIALIVIKIIRFILNKTVLYSQHQMLKS